MLPTRPRSLHADTQHIAAFHARRRPEQCAGQTPPPLSPRQKLFCTRRKGSGRNIPPVGLQNEHWQRGAGGLGVLLGGWGGWCRVRGAAAVYLSAIGAAVALKARMYVEDVFGLEGEKHRSVCSSVEGRARGEPCTHTNAGGEKTCSVIHTLFVSIAL